jgi:hypothetical protein
MRGRASALPRRLLEAGRVSMGATKDEAARTDPVVPMLAANRDRWYAPGQELPRSVARFDGRGPTGEHVEPER